MVQNKLKNYRKNKFLTQQQMAQLCAMDQTTYSRKESGKSSITEEEWQRFAKVLQTDVNEIKPEEKMVFKNENCTFTDNAVGIQYVNIPKEVLDTILRYNQKLEEEVRELKNNN
jgi:transcriptional regulator with XRE-family HTH domain